VASVLATPPATPGVPPWEVLRDGDEANGLGLRPATVELRLRAVERAIEAIRDRFATPLTLDELARVGALSPYHFNRVFRLFTGVPPGRFLTAVRMEEAKRLLLTTPKRVTDICLEVGYTSLGTFTSHFKELVGVGPVELRRLARASAGLGLADLSPLANGDGRGERSGVRVSIEAPDGFAGVAFAGLFTTPLPRARPAACAVGIVPGVVAWSTSNVPDGRYFVLVAAFDGDGTVGHSLLADPGTSRVGLAARPVTVADGRCGEEPHVALRAPQPTDPPVLLALPLVLLADQQLAVAAAAV